MWIPLLMHVGERLSPSFSDRVRYRQASVLLSTGAARGSTALGGGALPSLLLYGTSSSDQLDSWLEPMHPVRHHLRYSASPLDFCVCVSLSNLSSFPSTDFLADSQVGASFLQRFPLRGNRWCFDRAERLGRNLPRAVGVGVLQPAPGSSGGEIPLLLPPCR